MHASARHMQKELQAVSFLILNAKQPSPLSAKGSANNTFKSKTITAFIHVSFRNRKYIPFCEAFVDHQINDIIHFLLLFTASTWIHLALPLQEDPLPGGLPCHCLLTIHSQQNFFPWQCIWDFLKECMKRILTLKKVQISNNQIPYPSFYWDIPRDFFFFLESL